MFCDKCGNQLPDGAKFCDKCGAQAAQAAGDPAVVGDPAVAGPQPAAEPASGDYFSAPGGQQPAAGDYFSTPGGQQPAPDGNIPGMAAQVHSGTAWVKILIAVVVVAVLGLGVKGIFFRSSPEKPLDYLVQTVNKGDSKYLVKMFPKQVQSILKSPLIKSSLDSSIADMREDIENEVGRNAKMSYKVKSKTRLSKDERENFVSGVTKSLSSLMSFGSLSDSTLPDLNIKDAYELEVELTIKGADGSDSEEIELVSFKLGGNWYIIPDSLF